MRTPLGERYQLRFQPRRLRLAMREENLSAYSLAQRLEVLGVKTTQQAILRHLKGEVSPNSDLLGAYATFFRLPVDYFFTPMPGEEQ